MWSDLLVKISNTPIDFFSSIEDNVYLVLVSMKSFQKFDISKASKVQSTMAKLEHIQKEIVDLKEQSTSLCANLKGQKQLSHNAQAKVHEIEEDIATL
ncbi:UNVERIFIED_CONTAM: hypothetical protein Sindi_1274200 [Sesamum indicum]